MVGETGKQIVYCTGTISYDERVALPDGVFSSLEKAMASVKLRPGEAWKHDAERDEWTVLRGGASGHDKIILSYEVDPDA